MERSLQWVAGARCIEGPAKVDVLLVIDDSPSMSDEAQALAANLRDFGMIYDLDPSALDYRIAVTTTHVSGPDCEPGTGGALQLRTCTEHLDDFVTQGSAESADADVRDVCSQTCSWQRISTVPTAVAEDALLRPRPWLQRDRGRRNISEQIPIAEALTCIGQVGLAGCASEAPIAAASGALRRMLQPGDPNAGFLRDDAGLVVVFIGDEDDCSRPEGAAEPLTDAEHRRSVACWAAAARCETTPQGVWCDPAASDRLWDLDAFIDQLDEIEAHKQRVLGRDVQRVFVSAVSGVPHGFPAVEQLFGPSDDAGFDAAFGTGPGCARNDRTAAPTVRLREIAEAFAPWEDNLVSSCSESWVSALACIPNAWPPLRDTASCIDVSRFEAPTVETVAASCVLTETVDGQRTRIPNCEAACADITCEGGPTSWRIPEGDEACVAWALDDAQQWCAEQGLAEARVVRRDDRWQGWCYDVSCADTL